MIQEYYAFCFNKTKSKLISSVLAKLLYFLKIVGYMVKRLNVKDKYVNVKNARDIVSEFYPKPEYSISAKPFEGDSEIDASVIIPVYNYKDIISICIDSVMNQKTKYSFEVVLVDDGSTDGSSEIVDSYSKFENVVVIHKPNGGIGSARNAGLDVAKGKYVMFVDCDDYVHEDYVETLLNEAYEKNVDIVICGYTLVKKQNENILSKRDILYSEKNLIGYDESEKIMNYQGLPWNKTYKRELFNDIRYIPGYWYEDMIIHFLVFRKCNSYSFVDKSLYDYMWYENNFSHTQGKSTKKSLQLYWLLEILIDESNRIGLDFDLSLYRTLIRHMSAELLSGISSFNDDIKFAVFTCCSDLIKANKPECKYKLTYFDKQNERALVLNDYNKWELVAKYR